MAEERDPSFRVRKLCQFAGEVEVDNSIVPKKYFRSGVEMERMENRKAENILTGFVLNTVDLCGAKVYYDEGALESAFILYSKFITLFVEKLPQHPEYAKASPADKAANKQSLRRIFNVAEELKVVLKEKYQKELEQFLDEQERKEQEQQAKRLKQEELEAEERARHEQEQQRIAQVKNDGQALVSAITPSAPTLIGDYPVPPTTQHESPGTSETPVGNNLRENGTPSAGRGGELKIEGHVSPPSYSSLYSVPAPSIPAVDRSTKPVMSADTSALNGLRNIHIPSELISHFLRLASQNTRRNLETCGILTGRLQNNKFCITHLLIPKQTSTSDSCSTLNEEELFEFQDSHHLITLGWIHTHPSQTSFMSSVDLHTHCGYQVIMPEAIAIVCSPKFDETGVFSLTQDYGLQFILNCKKPGFHPHPKEPPLYEESCHVQWDMVAKVEIADLR